MCHPVYDTLDKGFRSEIRKCFGDCWMLIHVNSQISIVSRWFYPVTNGDAGLLQDASQEDFDVFLAQTNERLADDGWNYLKECPHLQLCHSFKDSKRVCVCVCGRGVMEACALVFLSLLCTNFLDHVDWTSNLIIAGDYSNELCTM